MPKTATARTVIAAILAGLSISVYAADTPKSVDIPAGDLRQALLKASELFGADLVYSPEQVQGLKTHGVRGELTTEQAIIKLLEGTPLKLRTDPSGAILISSPAARKPVPVSTTGDGSSSSGVRLAQASSVSSARDAGDESQQRFEVEEVAVTGSRLRRARSEGPSPVVVISHEDIERSGVATTREMLNRVTQNAVSSDESGNALFLGGATVQLRGLPVGTTLLLLNGRRLGASGAQVSSNFFDLNNIPLAAIERVEILPDSASAIYGADAIGGAVNVILKKDFTGVGASLRYGTSGDGDATERNGSLAFGAKGSVLSGMLVLDYLDRDPLFASDRKLTSSDDFTRFGGQDTRSTYGYPANVQTLDGSNLPGLNHSFAGVPAGTNGIGLTPADFAATDGVLNRFDGAPYKTLQADANRKSAFASAHYTPSSSLDLFTEILYTHREQVTQLPPDVLPSFVFQVPATNPFNPFGVPVAVDYSFSGIGPRANDSTTDFSRYLVGAQGKLGERFDWQAYVLSDRDSTDVFNRGFIYAYLLPSAFLAAEQALNSTDPNTALNVFSTTGNGNAAALAAIRAAGEPTDNLSTRANMAEVVVNGPLFDLPAGALNVAVGGNYRREKVDFLSSLAGDLRSTRSSEAAFAEVSVPLVSPAQHVPAAYSLELSAALRHDRYHESGADLESKTNPQFGVVWRPVSSLLLRSSYGEAFKEPTAFDLLFPRVTVPGIVLDPLRNNAPSQITQTFGGNPGLAPEKGRSLTAGLVWEPRSLAGFSLDLNAFRVQQTDFITSLDADTLLLHAELFPGRVVRAAPVTPGTPGELVSVDVSNINFGRLTVKGADLQMQYRFPGTSYGKFVGTLGGTYIDEYEILTSPGAQPLNLVNHANTAGYPVRFKGNAGLNWSGLGGWSASVAARYLNSYLDYDGVRRLPSQTWFDAQVVYQFGDRLAIGPLRGLQTALGVINLTNNQGDFSDNFAGYDPRQADIRGRFYYLNLRMSF